MRTVWCGMARDLCLLKIVLTFFCDARCSLVIALMIATQLLKHSVWNIHVKVAFTHPSQPWDCACCA